MTQTLPPARSPSPEQIQRERQAIAGGAFLTTGITRHSPSGQARGSRLFSLPRDDQMSAIDSARTSPTRQSLHLTPCCRGRLKDAQPARLECASPSAGRREGRPAIPGRSSSRSEKTAGFCANRSAPRSARPRLQFALSPTMCRVWPQRAHRGRFSDRLVTDKRQLCRLARVPNRRGRVDSARTQSCGRGESHHRAAR